jgi:hypothetical protein
MKLVTPFDITATAGNEATTGADGFGLLAPYGDKLQAFAPNSVQAFRDAFPGVEVGADGRILGIQRITKANSAPVATAFNSPLGKLRRWSRGAAIYLGHPDAPGASSDDPAERGLVTQLDARPDGLYGRPVYNELGAQALNSDEKLFFSVRMGFTPTGVEDGKIIFEPHQFISLGLTPTPHLAADAANTSPNPKPQDPVPEHSMKNIVPLIAALAACGFSAANESDDAILAAVNKLGDAARAGATAANERDQLKTKLAAVEADLATLKATAANETAARNKGLIDSAIAKGVLTEADRAKWDGLLKADAVNAATILAELTVKVKVAGVTGAAAAAAAGAVTAANESPEGFVATVAKLKAADPKASTGDILPKAVAENSAGHAAWIAASCSPKLG